jgi:hypothetical protein
VTDVRPFEDRRDRMFGRERDLQALQDRVPFRGLTAVVGRPQMGKSWLLTELARRLAHEHNPPYAVGFAESFGQTPDLLARAVADLYARWLSDAGMAEQARAVWEQQGKNLLYGLASSVSKVVSAVFETVAKPITVAIEEAINGLVAANETLTSGGLKLPTLHYEQARDLVSAVTRISSRPVVLFLDQWEKSPDAKAESHTLDAFLHHLDDWPVCHVVMALTPDEPAYGIVKDLTNSRPVVAQPYSLESLDLDNDAARGGLLHFLKGRIPAVDGVPEAQVLALIDGFPGVIGRWTDQREAMRSAEDLERFAADAHKYRFRELDSLLPELQADARRLAARLTLLPLAADPGVWDGIKPQVCDGLNPEMLDDLRLCRVLESAEPPSFGHVKRWDAARAWFIENRKNTIKPEAEALILAFASRIRDASANASAPTMALIVIGTTSGGKDLPDLHRAVCEAAMTLFGLPGDAHAILRGAQAARTEARAAPLISMSLFNTLIHAEAAGDRKRREAVLHEVRRLSRAYGEDATIRKVLAMGLSNALASEKQDGDLERRDTLLKELRALRLAYREDAAIREQLARGLFNSLIRAKLEDDLDRRDGLLDELRELAEAHDEDAAVREWLAKGLFNTLTDAKEENDLDCRDALLDELRELAAAPGEDAAVREWLAKGLFNTLTDAKEENDLDRRDALLEELHGLAVSFPADQFLQEVWRYAMEETTGKD